MVQQRGIERVRVLQGLVSLANKHPEKQINRACEIALSHGALSMSTPLDGAMEHCEELNKTVIRRPKVDH